MRVKGGNDAEESSGERGAADKGKGILTASHTMIVLHQYL